MTSSAPFAADTYELDGVRLQRITGSRDAADVAALFAAIPPWRTLGYSVPQLQGFFTRPDPALNRFCVRSPGGTLQGAIAVRYPWLRGPYLEILGLSPAARGQGLGRQLIGWMAAEAGPASQNLWALVSAFNDAARQFYRRQGFVEIATLADFLVAGSDELLLRKTL
jgi:ribosomal protein S18 acetylase RimI-like enzyme